MNHEIFLSINQIRSDFHIHLGSNRQHEKIESIILQSWQILILWRRTINVWLEIIMGQISLKFFGGMVSTLKANFRDKLHWALTAAARKEMIDDIDNQFWTLTFIVTSTEFTTQDYTMWSNVSKLSLIGLRDIDVWKIPKLSGLGNLRRLFSSFSMIFIVSISNHVEIISAGQLSSRRQNARFGWSNKQE
jgi:hypothetical protein